MSHVTFHPYVVLSAFLALRSTPNACNWCPAQAMNMAKNVDVGLNNEYGGNLKGRCLLLDGGSKGAEPLTAHANCDFSDSAHTLWWVPEAFPLL